MTELLPDPQSGQLFAASAGKSQNARLILATPVALAESIEALRSDADEVVCLETPEDFFAVGQFCCDFRQVSDDEVEAILGKERTAEARS
jgi:putative phosphoribosyl transferase